MDKKQIVVRSFRGAQLVLAAVHPDRGFAWVADRSQALKLEPVDALRLARAAAIHWGADCVTVDAAGVLSQPIEARKAGLTGAQIMRLDMQLQRILDSEDTDAADDFAATHIEPYGYTRSTWETAVRDAQASFAAAAATASC